MVNEDISSGINDEIRIIETCHTCMGLFRYTNTDNCVCFTGCVADCLDFFSICVDGLVYHALEEIMVICGRSESTPYWKGWNECFWEDYQVGFVFGCLVDEGDGFFGGLLG